MPLSSTGPETYSATQVTACLTAMTLDNSAKHANKLLQIHILGTADILSLLAWSNRCSSYLIKFYALLSDARSWRQHEGTSSTGQPATS